MRVDKISNNKRVDESGRAYAGSMLQTQIYVNRRKNELDQAIKRSIPQLSSADFCIKWVSPLEADKFTEYKDSAFLRAIGHEELAGPLREFWPGGGPNWDALAVIQKDGLVKNGILLVEAKSYPGEIYGPGCKASSPTSRMKIDAALSKTRNWLSVTETTDWLDGKLYQSANRLAHLYFFRELMGISAWLVNLYFIKDPLSHQPTGQKEWDSALFDVKKELGFVLESTIPYSASVFLVGRSRHELLEYC